MDHDGLKMHVSTILYGHLQSAQMKDILRYLRYYHYVSVAVRKGEPNK